jgi:5'-3' exonuclease
MLKIRLNTIIKGNNIHFESFHGLLNHYYVEYESTFLIEIEKKKKHWKPRLKSELGLFDKELEKLEYYPYFKHEIDIISGEKKFLELNKKDYEIRYYRHYFNIHSWIMDIEYTNRICEGYIDGIQWVLNYYLGELKDWTWYYRWRNSPLLMSLCVYMNKRIYQKEFEENGPLYPFIGLGYVLPPESFNILPLEWNIYWNTPNHELRYEYPIKYELETFYKNMLWECEPILPEMNIDIIKKYMNPLVEKYEELNRFRSESIV